MLLVCMSAFFTLCRSNAALGLVGLLLGQTLKNELKTDPVSSRIYSKLAQIFNMNDVIKASCHVI